MANIYHILTYALLLFAHFLITRNLSMHWLQGKHLTEPWPMLQGIQITATTPTSNAVRFETGEITLDLSNRVQISAKDTGSDNGNCMFRIVSR